MVSPIIVLEMLGVEGGQVNEAETSSGHRRMIVGEMA
jgi:hypothetical protein